WIPHKEMPNYLNELKLLVLPSSAEGLPNIMLEAMACGTPVIVSPVGAVEDIIEEEENGFLLKNNSSEEIANMIIKVIEYENIDTIIKKARSTINEDFTFNSTLKTYERVLKESGVLD
ncbi:MAG: glycosyltransferase family 4 protein, partial [Promethearchaeia archaeon]